MQTTTATQQNVVAKNANYPLDNVAYDVVSLMYQKSKALEAYDQYMQDAQQCQELKTLLEEIQRVDRAHVESLKNYLGKLLNKEIQKKQ